MQKRVTKEQLAALTLILCMGVVGVWLILAAHARSGFDEFVLTGRDLQGFAPSSEEWYVERKRLVTDDPIEPNIIAHSLRRRYPLNAVEAQSVYVRLVHGYNMCDCMRIKGYKVELIEDHRPQITDYRRPTADDRPAKEKRPKSNGQLQNEERRTENEERIPAGQHSAVSSRITDNGYTNSSPPPYQLWRLTSSSGDVSVWVTTMLRATDFSPTDLDTRDMAFPRVAVPDAQGWTPRGLSWRSLRHPVRNLRKFLQAKWNASRCDILTFLGLRRPAWASDEVLTLVSTVSLRKGMNIDRVADHVLSGHVAMLGEYQRWAKERATTSTR